jgi:hypothetical protein
MNNEIKALSQRVDFLRHCADVAERNYVAPAAPMVDEDDIEDAPLQPLHERLRFAATQARELQRALESIEELREYVDDINRSATEEAKKQEWYDDAYTGFCGG